MIRATRAEFGETRGVVRINEAQDLLVILHGADETLLLGNLTAEPWQNRREVRLARGFVERLAFRTTEGSSVATLSFVFRLDELAGLLDAIERVKVAVLFVFIPRDKTVLAHHDGLHIRVFLTDVLHGETELKTRAHPRHVAHFAAEDFLRELFAVLRSRDRDDRIRMHVIDILRGDEAVQRRID